MKQLTDLLPRCSLSIFLFFISSLTFSDSVLRASDAYEPVTTGELHLFSVNGRVNSALLQETDIEVNVNGMIARVIVRQTFQNTQSSWVEGEYLFPLSNRSAVDSMTMKIGDRVIVGRIREKEAARRQYNQAKAEGKKASLVSQQRPNLFTNRVANIGPGETIMVELQYVETLRYDQGLFSLRLPTTITPRYIPGNAFRHYHTSDTSELDLAGSGWSVATVEVPDAPLITPPMVATNMASKLLVRATINAGIALDTIQSLHHAATVSSSSEIYTIALNPGATLSKDVVLQWAPRTGRAPVAAMFRERIDKADYLLMMLMPPQQLESKTVLPREMIYIIDTSGSMKGVSIAQAREALLRGLQHLSPRDRFNVIEFNSHHNALWADAVAATDSNIARATRYIQGLNANGGTNMAPALQFAFAGSAAEGMVRQIVFITDGSVGNEAALFNLITSSRGSSRLFTVGIGS